MAQFKAFDLKVEVNGETVLSIVDGMSATKNLAAVMLKRHGIDTPRAGQWYSQQDWLDAFKEIAEKVGPNTLYQIGLKIPENAKFPPGVDTVISALSAIDVAYHLNHRNGEIGHYRVAEQGNNVATMVCHNPYPCEFDRGIIAAMAMRLAGSASLVTVTHDDSAPCRKKNGESCTYCVAWT